MALIRHFTENCPKQNQYPQLQSKASLSQISFWIGFTSAASESKAFQKSSAELLTQQVMGENIHMQSEGFQIQMGV